ncbi:FG-GAP-like repeat-containing protein [Stieleria sp. TO1_6]|uniref:FG-GAP-like repeat-containing protein n=1 Tax=Stieleria tagensis TaxID=2956795 RepID=UPI00209B6AE5|nr:FG-GAP-like repeat-containing protein [Stieleria tagensis]MCO8123786.1 FG-GAP-like repeat-containing protein [Stieleria tagensis]
MAAFWRATIQRSLAGCLLGSLPLVLLIVGCQDNDQTVESSTDRRATDSRLSSQASTPNALPSSIGQTAIAASQGVDQDSRSPDAFAGLEKAYFSNLEAGNWDAAESVARGMAEQFADRATGHRYLARLLSSQGRRQEASESVRRLLRMGAADAREVLSLIDVSGPFQLVSFDRWLSTADPGLFALGAARQSYIAETDPDAALEYLDGMPSTLQSHPSASALRGRILAETKRDAAYQNWLANVPDGIDAQSDYWAAVGTWQQHHGRSQASLGPLVQAIQIDPTDRKVLRLIATALTDIGQDARAGTIQTALAKLDTVFRKSGVADAADAYEIGTTLESLLRPWEALGWYQVAGQLSDPQNFDPRSLARRAAAVRQWESRSDPQQIRVARTKKLLGFEPTDYPLPQQFPDAGNQAPTLNASLDPPSANQTPLRLRDVASEAGIQTAFVSGYNTETIDFYLHQANGGGLAALDFDRDGSSDVFVVQSGGDPNRPGDSQPNELYRQTSELVFQRVPVAAGVDACDFGQGVCASDLNQDGFVDLIIANIGRNQMLINQGDGTFRDVTSSHFPAITNWTSSVGAGDLDGDGLPDLVEVNYVDDPRVFQQKCQGTVIACVPQSFRAAKDRFLKGTADGRFVVSDTLVQGDVPAGYGFGLVIANFDDRPGNEVFISNDGDLNHFWQTTLDTSAGGGLIEAAGIRGCAIGSSGISEACMGIASADFDHDGRLDLAVSNFHKEPLNLFLQRRPGAFVDDAMRRGVDVPSRSVLGFGLQAADLDNDGWQDLCVLNGHLYDYQHQGIAYRMRPQLFRGSKIGFREQTATDQPPYFNTPRLGRTLAQADFDGDGRVDLLANHLDANVALLKNDTDAGNWIQLELIGTTSDRNAVGAVAEIIVDDETLSAWVTGGDGYMCSNQPVLHIGLGDHDQVDQLIIHWPSGNVQSMRQLPINQRLSLWEP